ncbi:AAA family ATPase [Duganella aceris]|uniref:AAA family ATPase n=1 Tax=Duganella aceris TaxID=2703883 RepID=A0ABX0FFU3_9BURK|nr:AAA family ATPase [Duganella aceris]NGZ83428.1 AAA family ATPase [Duganella aceris]
MIEQITVKNFKSLADVTINFSKFNCFVGMNGAGKTTVLQVLDFISQQMRGDISGWLEERGWSADDLAYQGPDAPKLPSTILDVRYRLGNGELLRWTGFFNRPHLQMITEVGEIMGDGKQQIFSTVPDFYTIDKVTRDISFNYEGSVLSQLRDSALPAPLLELRTALMNMRSMYLLAPHLLRNYSRPSDNGHGIAAGGDRLPAFLDGMTAESKEKLTTLLRNFYPNLNDFKIVSTNDGLRRLYISERRTGLDSSGVAVLETSAGHLNDGLLRILAILAQIETDSTNLLLLDEVENGINPEITEKLVDLLVQSPAQIVITTHSPMILNYIADDVARKSVQFVFKDRRGQTDVQPFFSLTNTAEKLAHMGPGEAFVDTNLEQLSEAFIEARSSRVPEHP